jgi:DNA repair photolyase
MVKEIIAKNALHYHKKEFASKYDLNVYRGCGHRCKYCFAQYSHKYLESGDFFGEIFVKINIDKALKKQFSKKSWKKEKVTICGVSDPYQPIEKKYRLMPKILKIFKRYRNPVVIITKSELILRDKKLIEELAKVTDVEIVTSICTLDEKIRKKIEPCSSSSLKRLSMLKELGDRGCRTSVLLMPIIPYLTDDAKNLKEIFKKAKENNIDNILTSPLHLRGNTKKEFFKFIAEEYPDKLVKLKKLYNGAYASKEYRKKLKFLIFQLRKKYGLFYKKPKNKRKEEQLKLCSYN